MGTKRYIIRNDTQDAWLNGRVWYAHEEYADKYADRQDADSVASIMEQKFPKDQIRVVLSDIPEVTYSVINLDTGKRVEKDFHTSYTAQMRADKLNAAISAPQSGDNVVWVVIDHRGVHARNHSRHGIT